MSGTTGNRFAGRKQRARLLARRGLQTTDRWYDRFYGITTPSEEDAARPAGAPVWRGPEYEQTKHQDNAVYVSSTFPSIKSHLRKLNLGPRDVFYDIGCGKGRVVCMAALHNVRKVVGIEIDEGFADIARRNARRLRRRRSVVEIRTADAATADVSDGTVFYVFAPFGRLTTADFLENLRRSVEENPRQVKVLFKQVEFTEDFGELFEETSFMKKIEVIRDLAGHKHAIWTVDLDDL